MRGWSVQVPLILCSGIYVYITWSEAQHRQLPHSAHENHSRCLSNTTKHYKWPHRENSHSGACRLPRELPNRLPFEFFLLWHVVTNFVSKVQCQVWADQLNFGGHFLLTVPAEQCLMVIGVIHWVLLKREKSMLQYWLFWEGAVQIFLICATQSNFWSAQVWVSWCKIFNTFMKN